MKLNEWLWLVLIILSLGMFIHAIYKRAKNISNKFYSLISSMSSCVMFWMFCEFMTQYSTNNATILFFHESKYLFIIALPILFFYNSFAVKTGNRISKKVILATSLLCVLSFVIVITNNCHHLFRKSLEVIHLDDINLIHTDNGIFFFIVIIYSYLFIAIALRNFIIAFNDHPLMFRNRELYLIIAIIIPVFFNVAYQIGHILFSADFDPTPIGFFITVSIFYYLFLLNNNITINSSARSYMVDYMDTGMLYINQFDHIYDANKAFLEMADVELSDIFDKPISALEKEIFRLISNIKNKYEVNSDYDHEYTYLKGNVKTTQQITLTMMTNTKGINIGELFTFNDITMLKDTLADLKYISIHDQLTKLKNRLYYDRAIKELNAYEHFPLGLIICDIQHLKFINDTQGSIAGDALLIDIARKLISLAPEKATTCRIGSSEFAVIIPNTNLSEVKTLIDTMLQLCKQKYISGNEKSVKIGYAIRIDDKLSLTDFLNQVSINTFRCDY